MIHSADAALEGQVELLDADWLGEVGYDCQEIGDVP